MFEVIHHVHGIRWVRVCAASAAAFLALGATNVSAQSWYQAQPIERFRVHSGEAYLRLAGAPPNTCSNYGEQFRIDTSTALGRQALAVLLVAQTTGSKVTVWYTNSTAPGTNDLNGCHSGTSALLTGIALAP